MATGVGLRIGNVESVAAVVSDAAPTAPEFLVRNTEVMDSAITDRTADPEPTVVATEILALLGDVTTQIATPDSIVATYPATWSMPEVEALRTRLDSLGLDEVALVVDDGNPTLQQAALRGAQLATASLAANTATITVPRVRPADGHYVGAMAYSALPDAPASGQQPAPIPQPPRTYAPVPPNAPQTMEFRPIAISENRRSAAGSAMMIMLTVAFVITVIAGAFYFGKMLPETWGNLGSQGAAGNESTEPSSNFDPAGLSDVDATPTITSSPTTTAPASETTTAGSTTTELPPTSTSEPTLTNSAGRGPVDLG